MLEQFFKLLDNLSLKLLYDVFSLSINFLRYQLFEFSDDSCFNLVDLFVFHVLNTDLCFFDKVSEFLLDYFF